MVEAMPTRFLVATPSMPLVLSIFCLMHSGPPLLGRPQRTAPLRPCWTEDTLGERWRFCGLGSIILFGVVSPEPTSCGVTLVPSCPVGCPFSNTESLAELMRRPVSAVFGFVLREQRASAFPWLPSKPQKGVANNSHRGVILTSMVDGCSL